MGQIYSYSPLLRFVGSWYLDIQWLGDILERDHHTVSGTPPFILDSTVDKITQPFHFLQQKIMYRKSFQLKCSQIKDYLLICLKLKINKYIFDVVIFEVVEAAWRWLMQWVKNWINWVKSKFWIKHLSFGKIPRYITSISIPISICTWFLTFPSLKYWVWWTGFL